MPKLDSGGRRADRRHFFAQHLGLCRIEPAATIFSRPVRHSPAAVAHSLKPDALRLGGKFRVAAAPEDVGIGNRGTTHLRRAVGLQSGAGFAAKLLEISHGRFHLQMTCYRDRSKKLTSCVPSKTQKANDRRQTLRSVRSPAMEPTRPLLSSPRPVAPLRQLIFRTGADHIAFPASTRSILLDYSYDDRGI